MPSKALACVRTDFGSIVFHDDGTFTLETEHTQPGLAVPFAEDANRHLRSLMRRLEQAEGMKEIHTKLDRFLASIPEKTLENLAQAKEPLEPGPSWIDRWKAVPTHRVSSPFLSRGESVSSAKDEKAVIDFLRQHTRMTQYHLPSRELPRFLYDALPGSDRTYDMMHVYSLELARPINDHSNWAVWTRVGENSHLQLIMLGALRGVPSQNPHVSMINTMIYLAIEAERKNLRDGEHVFVDVAYVNQPVPAEATQGPYKLMGSYLKLLGDFSVSHVLP